MNTESEFPPTDFIKLERTAVLTKLDETAATLETKLQSEQDGRREERFWWLFAISIVADALILPPLGFMAGPVFLLQMVGLIYAAKRLGVDAAVMILGRLFDRLMKRFLKGDD